MITVDQIRRSIQADVFPMATKIVVEDVNMTFRSEKVNYVEFFLKQPIENLNITVDEDEPEATCATNVMESWDGKEYIFTLANRNYLVIPKSNIIGTFYHTLASEEPTK